MNTNEFLHELIFSYDNDLNAYYEHINYLLTASEKLNAQWRDKKFQPFPTTELMQRRSMIISLMKLEDKKRVCENCPKVKQLKDEILHDEVSVFDAVAKVDEFIEHCSCDLHKDLSTTLSTDTVNRPEYYKPGKYEAIDVIEDWKLDFDLGTAIQYICRAGKKSSSSYEEDLRKAIWAIERAISVHSNMNKN